jgi:hypothetical protein
VVQISVVTKLARPRVLLHPFPPTALAGGQLLYGARQSSGIVSLIRLLDLDEMPLRRRALARVADTDGLVYWFKSKSPVDVLVLINAACWPGYTMK